MSDSEISLQTSGTAGKRGRGRPKKDSALNNNTKNGGIDGIDTIKNGTSPPKEAKKRGRKPRDTSSPPKSGPSNAKRGRGRPKSTQKAVKTNSKKGGKRGRPKKTESVEEEAAPLDEEEADASLEEEEEDED